MSQTVQAWLAVIAAVTALVTALGGATGIVLIIRAIRGQTAATQALTVALTGETSAPVAARTSAAGADDDVLPRVERLLRELAHPAEGSARGMQAVAYVREFVAENAAARALWKGLADELAQPTAPAQDAAPTFTVSAREEGGYAIHPA